tara:strand:+ start:13327 stop:14772 length:1446 start_codon:yes stop_codon:yes gene_type:complete
MEELDYKKLGLKCGLEIHQQLDTKKLFCNCPSLLRYEEPDSIIKRKLHAVAGESGEIDKAAEYQKSLDKEFLYQGYDTTCLVEYDESPPREINKEALKITLQIAILLNSKILPITQIMRKTVIDGSNTSGFQRTIMIARDGFIETKLGKVKIEGIFLEEDSARLINKKNEKITYRLDRLGIPLVEISTSPEIYTPKQAKEVALHIGDILRSLKVKRGIGSIRQDVNVSIKKGNRVEIKGVQDPELIIKTINSEIIRQKQLIEKRKEINSEVRKANPDGTTKFLRPMPGSARMYPETDLRILKIHRDLINEIKRNLPKLRSEVLKELEKTDLNHEMIQMLFKQNKLEEFKELLKVINNPNLIAKIILVYPKEISSRKGISIKKVEKILDKNVFMFVLNSLKKKKISESQIKQILERVIVGKDIKDAIIFKKEDTNIIEEKIIKIIKEKPGLSLNAYMGLVMKEFHGKIDGKEVMEIIKKYVE